MKIIHPPLQISIAEDNDFSGAVQKILGDLEELFNSLKTPLNLEEAYQTDSSISMVHSDVNDGICDCPKRTHTLYSFEPKNRFFQVTPHDSEAARDLTTNKFGTPPAEIYFSKRDQNVVFGVGERENADFGTFRDMDPEQIKKSEPASTLKTGLYPPPPLPESVVKDSTLFQLPINLILNWEFLKNTCLMNKNR